MTRLRTDTAALRVLLPAAAFLLLAGAPACAHKMKIFAAAEGNQIRGYAYFVPSGRARNATIRVSDPSGRPLGETTTNERGEFAFEATCRCDHVLALDSADGHAAKFTVEADELPDDLPAPGASARRPPEKSPAGPAAGATTTDARRVVVGAVEEQLGALRAEIDRLRVQIRKHREEIGRYEDRVRLHDILGGVGYILGVAGIAFYFLGVRRRERRREASSGGNARAS